MRHKSQLAELPRSNFRYQVGLEAHRLAPVIVAVCGGEIPGLRDGFARYTLTVRIAPDNERIGHRSPLHSPSGIRSEPLDSWVPRINKPSTNFLKSRVLPAVVRRALGPACI